MAHPFIRLDYQTLSLHFCWLKFSGWFSLAFLPLLNPWCLQVSMDSLREGTQFQARAKPLSAPRTLVTGLCERPVGFLQLFRTSSGCWFQPLLKNISQWEGLSRILWKIKNVWNHPTSHGFFWAIDSIYSHCIHKGSCFNSHFLREENHLETDPQKRLACQT